MYQQFLIVLLSATAACSQPPPPSEVDPAPPPVSPVASARPSTDPNIHVCAGPATTLGVDVAYAETSIQWPTLMSAGYKFMLVKATEGDTVTNDLFAKDWATAKLAGVIRGAYHFFHPGDDPTTQANFFLQTVGTLANSDIAPVLDWEVTDGVSNAIAIARAQTWLTLVQAATGRVPFIYVDPSFWNDLGNPQQFYKYPLWIADWTTECPEIPPPWRSWTFWQNDATHYLKGIGPSTADQDVYNGSL